MARNRFIETGLEESKLDCVQVVFGLDRDESDVVDT